MAEGTSQSFVIFSNWYLTLILNTATCICHMDEKQKVWFILWKKVFT